MKKEIVERLLKAEQITFDEALELMDVNIQQQTPVTYPLDYLRPLYTGSVQPWWIQPQITC